MWTIDARGIARIFLTFLTLWLVMATPSLAWQKAATPIDLQAIQTGPKEVTVTFAPGEGGGAITGYFVNILPEATGSGTIASPYVFSDIAEGDHTVGVYALGVDEDSDTAYFDVTLLPAATLAFSMVPAQAFGASLDLGSYVSVTHGSGPSFVSDTPAVCDVSGQTLVQITVGACKITASTVADAGYFNAAPVQQTFMIEATEPGAPINVTAVAGNGEATVSFTGSSFDGGAAIDLYEVSSTPATGVFTDAGSPITFTGLSNGVSYTFSVRAHNSVGYSAVATSVSAVTPKGVQTITFTSPGAQEFGTTPTLTAASSSGLPVSLTSGSLSVCTISAGQVIFLTVGDCIINADQVGDGTYLGSAGVADLCRQRRRARCADRRLGSLRRGRGDGDLQCAGIERRRDHRRLYGDQQP